MKNLMYLLIFTVVLIFASCNKDGSVTPDPPPSPPPPPDTAWFSLVIEAEIIYTTNPYWRAGSCYIYFTPEQKLLNEFEKFFEEGDRLTFVKKEWKYEKDAARNHLGKKRFVCVIVRYWIPGTSQVTGTTTWKEIEIKQGINYFKFEFQSPP